MNINGAFQGLLPMSLAPWKVEFGAARQHMGIGDVVLARKDIPTSYHLSVTLDDHIQRIGLVSRGEDLVDSTHIHKIKKNGRS